MKGLSTNQGTNALIPLLIAFEVGKSFDADTQKWFYPVCLIAMCAVLWMIKGSGMTPSQGEEVIDTQEDIKDVIARGRK